MRGVLLCVLIFMLKDCNQDSLNHKMGADILGIYVHLFELTILFECWLDWDTFTRHELQLADKFIKHFTETFVKNVRREKGRQWKLAKIHQLRHFVPQI